MNYNPEKHHRRSIRLKGYNYSLAGAYFITICAHQRECLFGEVIAGAMILNRLGQVVKWHWYTLPKIHRRLQLDEFVVMPNHLHGILVLADDDNGVVGAGLGNNLSVYTENLSAKPAPTEDIATKREHGITEIIRGFKTFSARRINQIRHTRGISLWQRNYYEHIIRNEESLNTIRQYIINNPLSWEVDQLHPNNPSKW